MATLRELGTGLVLEHRARRRTMVTFYLIAFAALSFVVGPTFLEVRALGAPSTVTIECSRASKTCRSTSMWSGSWSQPWTMRQLSGLVARAGSKHLLGWRDRHGRVQHWSGAVSGTEAVASLEHGVAALNEFPNGTAPSLSVAVPNGRPAPSIAVLVVVLAIGLYLAYTLRRAVTRSTLWIDRDGGNVEAETRRALVLRSKRTFPVDRARRVVVATHRGLRYSTTTLTVEVADERPLMLVQEYTSSDLLAEVTAAADQLARALEVPRSGPAAA